jgi:hypothetical protein
VYQVLTEFLRKVFWSGPHNTIVAPAGHHIMEGRWLRDDTIIDDYARFWRTRLGGSAVLGAPQLATLAVCLLALLAGYGWRCAPWRRSDRAAQGPMRGRGTDSVADPEALKPTLNHPRFLGSGWRKQYTFWPAHALWQRSLLLRRSAAEGVTAELFPQLAANYRDWQRTHFSQKAGCLFQSCHADGQENSAGLDGCRPTVTAAPYGEANPNPNPNLHPSLHSN